MSFLHEAGDLSKTPLAALLLEALNLRASGTLEVQHDAGTSRLFFHDGVPVGAQTFMGFKPLGQFLLAKGLIGIEALDRSLTAMAETRRPQGELLVEMGAVSREALDDALSEQQAAYLAQIAALDSGRFSFDPARPPPEWTRGVHIQPLLAVVDALEKPQASALVASALRQAAAGPVRLSGAYREAAARLGWKGGEAVLVSRLERPSSLEVFLAGSPLAPERARALLAALLLLGLAEPAEPRVAAETPPGPVAKPVDAGAAARMVEARRGDPEEARRRRQRLLARAMQNMGVGPLSGGAPPGDAGGQGAPAAPEAPRARRGGGSAADEALRQAFESVMARTHEADYFARLGLPRTAGRDEVKQAYLSLAKQFHPDRFLSSGLADLEPRVKDLFAALNEAYAVLSDDKRRAAYLGAGAAGGEAAAEAARNDFKKGEACVKTRDFARARGFLEAAIRVDPRAEYQAALAWCLMLDPAKPTPGRVKELLAEATRDATCDRAFYLAGVAARDEGDEKRAEKMFRAALKANPGHSEALREVRLIEGRRKSKGEERSLVKK